MFKNEDRHLPLWLLFWAGAALVVVAIVALFANTNGLGASVFVFAGCVCTLAAVLVPRFDESSLEASGEGFRMALRRKVTREIGEALEEGVGPPAGERTGEKSGGVGSGESVERASTSIQYVDINNDGEAELVVQHPYGAHSVELQVFGWSDADPHAEFHQLASLVSEYASGFTVGDLDDDGRIEIASLDLEGRRSHAEGPTVQVIRRWDGSAFAEVARRRLSSF
jgi:hypothetical protein